MGFAGILLLSAALSIDAFNVGASCGFNRVRIPVRAKLVILLISTAVTSASVFAGGMLGQLITGQAARYIGAALLCSLGFYMGMGALKGEPKQKHKKARGVLGRSAEVLADASSCDADSSRRIEPAEASAIGLALSADAFAAGLSSGMNSGPGWLMPVFCGIFQMLFLFLGERFAKRLRKRTRIRPAVFGMLAGCVMVVMGVLRAVV